MSFKATLSTALQTKKVTVLGWDRRTKKPIKGEATLADVKTINGDLHPFIESTGREEVVSDQPVISEDDAHKTAIRSAVEEIFDAIYCPWFVRLRFWVE